MKTKLFNMSSEEKIRDYKPLKALIYFSIPTILMMLVISSYSLIDKYISLEFGASKILNEHWYVNNNLEARAVINAATIYAKPIIGLLAAFTAFTTTGISIPFAIAFGKNDKIQMQKILANGFIISLVVSLIVSICFYFIADPFVRFQSRIKRDLFDKQTQFQTIALMIDLAIKYDHVYTIGFTLLLFSNVLSAVLRNQGKTFIVSFINIIAVFINILLAWLLVAVCDLGMIGSVYGSIITWLIIDIVLLILILWARNNRLRFSINDFKLDLRNVKQICATGIAQFSLLTAWAFINFINNRLDTSVSEIEIMNNACSCKVPIVVQIWSAMGPWIGFLKAPTRGILQAAAILMGYAYGSKMYQRFWSVVKNVFWIVTLFYTIVFIIVLFRGNYMLKLFTATNPGRYRWAFVLIVTGFLFTPLSTISLMTFQTMQKNLLAFLVALIRPSLTLSFSILGWFIARQTYEPLWYFAFSAITAFATLLVYLPLVICVWNKNKHLVKAQKQNDEVK